MNATRENFIREHWDWLAAVAGIAVFAGAVVMSLGDITSSPETARAQRERALGALTPAHDGVAAVDLHVAEDALRLVKTPPVLSSVKNDEANFLASEKRVACRAALDPKTHAPGKACGMPIPEGSVKCPFCQVEQYREVRVADTTDAADGLDLTWKKKYHFTIGKNVAAADTDGDGFTNAEEFQMKTDPTDRGSHPDYREYLTIGGPIKQTFLPFYVREANRVPDPKVKGGWTYRVTLPRLKYGKFEEKQFLVKVGDPVAVKSGKTTIDTGFVLKAFEPKSEQRKIAGSSMKRNVDVSEAVFVRTKDKKEVRAMLGVKVVPVERTAELRFSRDGGKKFKVLPGSEISLHNRKYRIESFGNDVNKPTISVKDVISGDVRTIGLEKSSLD